MRADAWAALAAWVTVGIALGALIFAGWQVHEARKLREEQAAPYVVASMEVATRSFGIVDFVIKNLGNTGAHDIQVHFAPKPTKTSMGGVVDFPYPESLPFLAPGQEWRAAWDYGPRRAEQKLHEPYEVQIKFSDSKGRVQDTVRCRLDWALIWHQVAPDNKTTKHVVMELKSTREVISRGLKQIASAVGKPEA